MPKVSIIMPSLNVVDYIELAVCSVIKQTIKEIEIICVDAGSDDGTWEKLEEMSNCDNRITIVRTNIRSYGYQVNLGIRNASGKYIAIVETDDYVQPEMYETLYNIAERNSCDYVKADYKAFWTQKNKQKIFLERKNIDDKMLYSRVLCPKDYPSIGSTDWYIWTGIYSKEFLLKNNITFSESKGASFQDIGFLIKTTQSANRVMYIDSALYNYCIDREGASSNQNKSLMYSYVEFCKNYNALIERREDNVLFYARMARSFLLCTKEINEIDNSNVNYINWFIDKLLTAIDKGYINESILKNNIWKQLLLIINNKDLYFEEKNRKKQIFLEKASRNNSKGIIIFGCGNYGYDAYKWIKKNGLRVIGFMDNNSDLWNSKIDDLPVYSPQNVMELFSHSLFVIANEKYADDIKEQLLKTGISKKAIFEYL
jgi:glycosyltransferase involved in cell wall biosynthesis